MIFSFWNWIVEYKHLIEGSGSQPPAKIHKWSGPWCKGWQMSRTDVKSQLYIKSVLLTCFVLSQQHSLSVLYCEMMAWATQGVKERDACSFWAFSYAKEHFIWVHPTFLYMPKQLAAHRLEATYSLKCSLVSRIYQQWKTVENRSRLNIIYNSLMKSGLCFKNFQEDRPLKVIVW